MSAGLLPLNLSEKKQIFICIAVIIVLHIFHYFGAGLYQCRYSLFEDQEIIQTTEKIQEKGVMRVFVKQMTYEVTGRFRPLYVVYRISACYLLGDNIQLQHHFFYGIFIFSSFLLFWWGMVFGFSPFLSLLFTSLVFIGPQSAIGWRLANGENFALLFLSAGILCFLHYLKNPQRKFKIATGVLVLFATFSKESFIFCFGLFPLLYICQSPGKLFPQKKFWSMSGIAILVIALYILGVRFLIQNPETLKYAGSSLSLKDILSLQFGMNISEPFTLNFERIWQTIIFQGSAFQPYVALLVLGSIAALFFTPYRKVIIWSVVIVFSLLVIHKLLYLRLVLYKIYLFPVMVTIGFLLVWYLHELFASGKKIAGAILLSALLCVVVIQSTLAYNLANDFYKENLAGTGVTDALASYGRNQTIYVQADPMLHVECINSIQLRLDALGCSSNILVSPIEQGDSIEALRIMRITDPSLYPFLRKIFYKQFSGKITALTPEANLDGKKMWVIMQRPERVPPRYKEVEEHLYTQRIYRAGFYSISVLIPTANNLQAH